LFIDMDETQSGDRGRSLSSGRDRSESVGRDRSQSGDRNNPLSESGDRPLSRGSDRSLSGGNDRLKSIDKDSSQSVQKKEEGKAAGDPPHRKQSKEKPPLCRPQDQYSRKQQKNDEESGTENGLQQPDRLAGGQRPAATNVSGGELLPELLRVGCALVARLGEKPMAESSPLRSRQPGPDLALDVSVTELLGK
jgi:hypothetical protein